MRERAIMRYFPARKRTRQLALVVLGLFLMFLLFSPAGLLFHHHEHSHAHPCDICMLATSWQKTLSGLFSLGLLVALCLLHKQTLVCWYYTYLAKSNPITPVSMKVKLTN